MITINIKQNTHTRIDIIIHHITCYFHYYIDNSLLILDRKKNQLTYQND
jgi:hypothetical protein